MSSAIMHSSPAPLPPTESEKDVADEIVLNEDIAAADITHEGADAVHTVDGVSWTQEEERAIVRKMDWNIVPLVWALFMQVRVPVSPLLFPLDVCDLTLFSLFPRRLSFLDRSNIGNANTAGMSKYLGMSNGQYEWLLTIFYLGYSLGQPTTLLWKLIPPRYFVTFLTLCWGSFALLQACARWEGLMVLRLFLGVAETAFSPGVPLYLSFFYSRREIGFRQGIFLAAAPLASCYAGALAYGITQIKTSSIPVYKLLFLIEGESPVRSQDGSRSIPPADELIPLTQPTKARFLNERQREIARLRTARDGETGREGSLKWAGVVEGLKDPKAWICALMYFSCNVSYSSLPVFLPTILQEMGYSSIRAQGLSAPPYLGSFFILLASTYMSDKFADRTIFIIPLATIAGIGYLLLAIVKTTAIRYFAVFLAAGGLFPVIGLMLPLTSSLHEDDSKRSVAFLILNLIGQCGPFLGTRLYPAKEKPFYHKGMAVCSGFVFFVALLALVLRILLIRENAIRDKKYGYVDRKKQEAYQEMAVRARLPTPTATEKEEFEGEDVETAGGEMTEAEEKAAAAANGTLGSPAVRTRTGREKTEQEKKEDRERYWRYLL
ncbi:hypothetical protein C6P46_001847 [Rhodotorula mucilaginosa]|uniref:MFS general substrate transporter n=1 Tax=Rhodotorula mucilaginosa TaxID=5537 RepID=A0A9P6VUM7_RHOMI|nr:hypothetical protein C6P46_001847 [Rhodotorula mucilaginosa]